MTEGTGACGINCMVCGLFRMGKCGPCAGGREPAAQKKLATQLSLLGGVCRILACAVERKEGHCSADCTRYPCRLFYEGSYPLSQGYLDMQVRRRANPSGAGTPYDD